MSTKVKQEILKCAKDFKYFAGKYLKIVDVHGLETTLKLNQAQADIVEALESENHLMILKARKLGSTTLIAGYYLWKALFRKNIKIAVVAHTDEASRAIFSIYQFFYKNLPSHIKVRALSDRSNTLKLATGSMVKVGTASSESFRGQTYQYIHASEYAFWPNLDKTIAGLFGTADANATVILESTANGLNEAYEMWQSENGFTKMFMAWTIDARYTRKKAVFKDLSKLERAYTSKHDLNEAQTNWMVHVLRTKCANNWQIFNQEFPISAEMAFVTSGSRFFPDPWPVSGTTAGLRIYKEPQKFHVYAMGVDTASGSPGGDYSAIMLLDVSDTTKVQMAASYYDHLAPSDFKEIVHEMADKYQALAVVESNSYGLSIIEHLQEKSYPRQYRDQYWDKVKGMFTPRYGFNTNAKSRNLLLSRLYEYITRGWCEVVDDNFKAEANALVYNSRGKVEAASGKHDDIVIATGLALMGLDQVDDIVAEVIQQHRPSNVGEMLQWEAATGRRFSDAQEEEFAPNPLDDLLLGYESR
jgi:hypothetical protein